MFVDASAIVAVIAQEPGWERLSEKMEAVRRKTTSPLAIWEAIQAVARVRGGDFDVAEELVDDLVDGYAFEIVPITEEIGALAVEASRRFGRGRHPASLNFGDCFAYACARAHRVPLLFKGADFPQTDIETA